MAVSSGQQRREQQQQGRQRWQRQQQRRVPSGEPRASGAQWLCASNCGCGRTHR